MPFIVFMHTAQHYPYNEKWFSGEEYPGRMKSDKAKMDMKKIRSLSSTISGFFELEPQFLAIFID